MVVWEIQFTFSVIVLIALKTGHIIGGHIIPLKRGRALAHPTASILSLSVARTPGYTSPGTWFDAKLESTFALC